MIKALRLTEKVEINLNVSEPSSHQLKLSPYSHIIKEKNTDYIIKIQL